MEGREELTQKVNYLLFNFPAFAGKWIAFFSTAKVQNSEQRFCDYFVGVRRHWTEFSVDWCDGNRRQTSRWCSWYYCHFSRGEEWKLNFTLTRNLALVLNIYPPWRNLSEVLSRDVVGRSSAIMGASSCSFKPFSFLKFFLFSNSSSALKWPSLFCFSDTGLLFSRFSVHGPVIHEVLGSHLLRALTTLKNGHADYFLLSYGHLPGYFHQSN